jgi:hypothetical protein
MAKIENRGEVSVEDYRAEIQAMDNRQLLAQSLVTQGALSVVDLFIQKGCGDKFAADMLLSLRQSAALIREEHLRRGTVGLFERDQVAGS